MRSRKSLTARVADGLIRRIGARNIVIAATPAKLARTKTLHIDPGDPALDRELAAKGHLPVVTGYRESRMVKVVV